MRKEEGKQGGKPKKGVAKKIVAKTGSALTQWDILRSMGLGVAEIPPFVDADHWLRYSCGGTRGILTTCPSGVVDPPPVASPA